jgi:hypothetical protein
MAEAFHQWVNNMPWWEKLYYQLFDPQAITCSTTFVFPSGYILVPLAILALILFIWGWQYRNSNSDKQEIGARA